MTEEDQEIQNMYLQQLIEDTEVDPSKEMKYPPVALSAGDFTIETKNGNITYPIPIGTYGNFSFIHAPPKTKKTFLISLLSAVYIKGELNGFGGHLKGYREDKNIIHFDTEQGAWHCQRVFKRPLDMIREKVLDCYKTFSLRRLGHKDRVAMIEHYLYEILEKKNIGLVIIDGIADLISDSNNIDESVYIVQKLMTWSADLNCHIMTIIHSNFGTSKPTGHLGSFLEKKAETQIELEANTVNKELVTVICKRSRGRSFENFSFKVNKSGLPMLEDAFYDPLKGMEKF